MVLAVDRIKKSEIRLYDLLFLFMLVSMSVVFGYFVYNKEKQLMALQEDVDVLKQKVEVLEKVRKTCFYYSCYVRILNQEL